MEAMETIAVAQRYFLESKPESAGSSQRHIKDIKADRALLRLARHNDTTNASSTMPPPSCVLMRGEPPEAASDSGAISALDYPAVRSYAAVEKASASPYAAGLLRTKKASTCTVGRREEARCDLTSTVAWTTRSPSSRWTLTRQLRAPPLPM